MRRCGDPQAPRSNRGEIAVRIFRTCRALEIATVAVVAPDDRESLHAREADQTVEIGSYLHSEEHVRAAKQSGADAIHPGYGFLAENADFAEAVDAAGLVWVGPSPEALRAGGDKLEAKRIAREAGVPVVESGEPDELGFPLLLKAAAGGGGRGMRVVRSRDELADALEAARREAKAAFGDDRVFAERYVERPRHVEIQLLGDADGHVVSLGERECSIQRRHQKVLEESPSPALDAELRAAMSDAAVRFGRAIGYTSAGTAEFMLDGRDFFFLELNGRIQVEHPVTELVTGIDLVRTVRIASGQAMSRVLDTGPGRSQGREGWGGGPPPRRGPGPRPCRTSAVPSPGRTWPRRRGAIYAEDPRTFLPQGGRIDAAASCRTRSASTPASPRGRGPARVRPAPGEADRARGDARRRVRPAGGGARGERVVNGVTTNLPFLRWLVAHPDVRDGRDDDGVPRRAPAAVHAACAPAFRGNGAAPGGSTCPRRRRQAPPDLDAAAHEQGCRARWRATSPHRCRGR